MKRNGLYDRALAVAQRLRERVKDDPADTLAAEAAEVMTWLLVQAMARDGVANEFEEQKARAWEALREGGREAERLGCAAREMGWLDRAGRLKVGRDGRTRYQRVLTYVFALKENRTIAAAADATVTALGYRSRSALRDALRRDRAAIEQDPEAPERGWMSTDGRFPLPPD